MVLVKNEVFWLPYVLVQTEDVFTRYVIYDVGSTDGTKEIIEWWVDRMKGRPVEIFTRYLPHCPPEVQGTFRNSMIAEGMRDTYFILDGDELYSPADLYKIPAASKLLQAANAENPRVRYGVVQRTEVSDDLLWKYKETRTHHRLYMKDAWWTHTHPGEIPHFAQHDKSQSHYPDIMCWHMHNTLRTANESEVPGRVKRKSQRSYHPGSEKEQLGLKLLDTIPLLRKPIENFRVNPALEMLQNDYASRQTAS